MVSVIAFIIPCFILIGNVVIVLVCLSFLSFYLSLSACLISLVCLCLCFVCPSAFLVYVSTCLSVCLQSTCLLFYLVFVCLFVCAWLYCIFLFIPVCMFVLACVSVVFSVLFVWSCLFCYLCAYVCSSLCLMFFSCFRVRKVGGEETNISLKKTDLLSVLQRRCWVKSEVAYWTFVAFVATITLVRHFSQIFVGFWKIFFLIVDQQNEGHTLLLC